MIPAELGNRYTLLQELGRGATAIVYRARDRQLGLDVAVKVLAPHLSREAGAVERLRRELLAAQQITSEAVAQVYDFAEDGDTKYLVMEYGPAGTLKDQILLRGRLPPVQLDRLIEQLADALVACHAHGILHRDLKPSNILFDPETGRIKLIDFGVARIGDTAASSATTGMVGTPEYMAPEQFDDSVPDPRSDLYAVGAVLYEAATGRPPISGRTVPEIARKHQQGAFARPSVLCPALGSGAEALIVRLLARDPADRFQTAEELLAAVAGRSVTAAPAPADVAPVGCPRCGAPRERSLPFCPTCAASLDDFDRFGRWSVVVTASPDLERLRGCLETRLPGHAVRRDLDRLVPPLTVIEFASEPFARWLAEELRRFGFAAGVRCLGLPGSLALALTGVLGVGLTTALLLSALSAPGPSPLAAVLFLGTVWLSLAASVAWGLRRRFGRALAYVHPFPPRDRASAPLARARLAQGLLRSARYRAIGRGLLVAAYRLADFRVRTPGTVPERLFEESLLGAYSLLEALELQSAALASLAEPGETKARRRDALVRGTHTLLRLTALWRREQATVVRRAGHALARRVGRLEYSLQTLKLQQAELRDVLTELQSLAPPRPRAS